MGVSEKQNTDRKLLEFVEFFSQIISSLGFSLPLFSAPVERKVNAEHERLLFYTHLFTLCKYIQCWTGMHIYVIHLWERVECDRKHSFQKKLHC